MDVMRAGELRYRITIQQLVSGVDEYGQPVNTWQDVVAVWAKIEDLSGREYFQAQQVPTTQVNTRITIRWRSDVKPEMRVLAGEMTFDIDSVIDPTGQRRELQIMARKMTP